LSFYFSRHGGALRADAGVLGFAAPTATVLLFGALGCWGIFRRPPLEALRAQA
jgi:hypothetical protein